MSQSTPHAAVRELRPLKFTGDASVCVPDLQSVCDWNRFILAAGLGREDAQSAANMFNAARGFIAQAKWCDELLEEYVGLVLPDTIGVFLFRFTTQRPDIGEWGWVIAGSLPTGFITTSRASRPPKALELYVAGLRTWAEARKTPDSDIAMANLKTTIRFVEEHILPAYAADLAYVD